MLKCKSCEGVYEPTQPGGFRYFHACPPIAHVEVERAGAPLTVPLADVKPTDTITVLRAGKLEKVLVSAQQADDQRLGDTFLERPDKRDENVIVAGYDDKGTAIAAAKSEGQGVEAVA